MTIDPALVHGRSKNLPATVCSVSTPFFQNRTVARPVANLGNTCYINAVLQALAHAPELCLAMDCEPHCLTCPVAAENALRAEELKHQRVPIAVKRMSPSSSPEGVASTHTSTTSSSSASYKPPSSWSSKEPASFGTRKSRRAGRKSPRLLEDGQTSGVDSNDGDCYISRDGLRFCALCELEKHIRNVHDQTSVEKAVAPENFVYGFFYDVAPWFKLGVQEDSHEFLRLLIDAMQKSCRRARLPAKVISLPGVSVKELRSRVIHLKEDGKETESSPLKLALDSEDLSGDPVEDAMTRNETPENASTATDISTNQKETEYPFSLFRGTVESKVICSYCQATSSTLDPIEDVGLEVAHTDSSKGVSKGSNYCHSNTSSSMNTESSSVSATASCLLDVQSAFQRFASTEALDSGYKCEKCGQVGRATKQSRLASIPPILTLHLKRFRYGGNTDKTKRNVASNQNSLQSTQSSLPARTTRSTRSSEVNQLLGTNDYYSLGKSGSAKIEGHVKFDSLFDLRPYLTEQLQKLHSNMLCRLFAVVVHNGKNSHSGHYIAYVSNVTKNEWYKMDDSRVTPSTLQEVLQAEAYMLFYRIVQHPISTTLEELHQKKKSEMEAQNRICLHPSLSMNGSKDGSETNKRRNPEDPDTYGSAKCFSHEGDLWLKNKTNVPPHLAGLIRKAQDMIASEMELTPQFHKKLSSECLKIDLSSLKEGSTRLSAPLSPCSIITEDDVVGGTDKFRRKLIELFYRLEQEQRQDQSMKNGSSSNTVKPLFSHSDDIVVSTKLEAHTESSDNTQSGRKNVEKEHKAYTTRMRVVLEEPDDVVGLL